MKSITVIVIGFILASVLVIWPTESIQDITTGLGLILGGMLMAWLGVRSRKGTRKDCGDNIRQYTATTMMKVVAIDESIHEMWETQDDGSDQLRRERMYLPTYEYTVNGETYHYYSRQSLSSKRELGRQVVGYYDPNHPKCITEDKPRNPIFTGFGCFIFAAFMLYFGIMTFTGQVSAF